MLLTYLQSGKVLKFFYSHPRHSSAIGIVVCSHQSETKKRINQLDAFPCFINISSLALVLSICSTIQKKNTLLSIGKLISKCLPALESSQNCIFRHASHDSLCFDMQILSALCSQLKLWVGDTHQQKVFLAFRVIRLNVDK